MRYELSNITFFLFISLCKPTLAAEHSDDASGCLAHFGEARDGLVDLVPVGHSSDVSDFSMFLF